MCFFAIPFVRVALIGHLHGHSPILLVSGKMAGQAALGSSMSRNRFKSIALYATAGICLLLVLVGLLFAVEQRRTRTETGAVLSAFFSQVVLHDKDKWDAGRTITIVVMRNPNCRICTEPTIGLESQSWFGQSLKSRGSSVLEAWFAQSSRTTRASFFLNKLRPQHLCVA